jgi:alkylation response protein AidB-like acyl-CoA dehydrogenase
VAVALLEPGGDWSTGALLSSLRPVDGRKLAVEHAADVDRFAVAGSLDGAPALALVAADAAAVEPQPSLDVTVPLSAVTFAGVEPLELLDGDLLERLTTIGALLAAAEAVGAAARMLHDATAYAAERRQFGRTIGSNQALRHILADMYVRQASAWSTVLYAAAALDEGLPDARQTAAVAKAYVARAARAVAHGALQVFGGIAFTEEHQAHRFLRRILVREQQFGDAAHHERELGRALAERERQPA